MLLPLYWDSVRCDCACDHPLARGSAPPTCPHSPRPRGTARGPPLASHFPPTVIWSQMPQIEVLQGRLPLTEVGLTHAF